MEKHQDEVLNLQLKIHGQIATIQHNDINELFDKELENENIDYAEYQEAYDKITNYYTSGYEDNKEESDNAFVKEVVADMKRLMEVASLFV